MSELTYNRKTGTLTWGATHFKAISGPYGNGALPLGKYDIQVRKVVDGGLSHRYQDKVTGNSWFIPIKPLFSTTRDGFGIHPDGNVTGTKGCVGLTPTDANSFWTRWTRGALPSRPTKLNVVD